MRGFFVAAGFCAHGLAGAGGIGRVMAEWILEGEPGDATCGRWTSAASARTTARPSYTLKRAREVYETYYDIRYPGHERQAGRPLRTSSAYPWHAAHGAAFGEKSGWERVNWYEAQRAARAMSRCARAAGRGCTGRRRSAPSTAPRASTRGCSTSPPSPSSRSPGPARRTFLEAPVRQPRRARGRRDHLHADAQPPRRHRVRLHRHARRGGAVLDRHRHRLRQPRPQLDPPPRARGRQRALRRRDRALGVLRAVGPARARDPRAAHQRSRWSSPTCACASWPSATCRCARCA